MRAPTGTASSLLGQTRFQGLSSLFPPLAPPAKSSSSEAGLLPSLQHTAVYADFQVLLSQGPMGPSGSENQMNPSDLLRLNT